MNQVLVLALITIFIGFSLSFSGLYYFSRQRTDSKINISSPDLAFISLYISNFIIISLLFVFANTTEDSIYEIKASNILLPLALGLICNIIGSIKHTKKYINLALICAVSISAFLLPKDFLICQGTLPLWADRLVIIFCWSLLSCFYYLLNGLDGLLSSFSFPFFITPIILAMLNAAPAFYALSALSLFMSTSCLMIFGWSPAKLKISSNSCKIFGYIIGWLITVSSQENLISCYVILLFPFILEMSKAIFKKLLLRDRFENMQNNTTCYQAHISGLPAHQVCLTIIKIQIILIIISCFQAFVTNFYSLPIVSLFLTAWFLNKLQNWNEPQQNLREINQEFMDNLHQNINEIKEKIDRE